MLDLRDSQPIIALCGPSGTGKGFTKQRIINELSLFDFLEPVVCSTRPTRADDGQSRRAGLSYERFMEEVAQGMIVLPHQPFREGSSHWYGFSLESFYTSKSPVLTEVHSSIISEFIKLMETNHRILVLGLIGERSVRETSMVNRSGLESPNGDIDLRITNGGIEIEEIMAAYGKSLVNHVLSYSNEEGRNSIQSMAVNLVEDFLARE